VRSELSNHFLIESMLVVQINISLSCNETLMDITVNKHIAQKQLIFHQKKEVLILFCFEDGELLCRLVRLSHSAKATSFSNLCLNHDSFQV